MSTKRIRHTAKFKFQIALEAIKSDKTINQLASEYQLHPSQISHDHPKLSIRRQCELLGFSRSTL